MVFIHLYRSKDGHRIHVSEWEAKAADEWTHVGTYHTFSSLDAEPQRQLEHLLTLAVQSQPFGTVHKEMFQTMCQRAWERVHKKPQFT